MIQNTCHIIECDINNKLNATIIIAHDAIIDGITLRIICQKEIRIKNHVIITLTRTPCNRTKERAK